MNWIAILTMSMIGSMAIAGTPEGGARARQMMVQVPTNAMLGTWSGTGGRILKIAADGGPYSGRYRLSFKPKGGVSQTITGLAHLDTIHFTRNGRAEVLRGVDADFSCLVVGSNERYCRKS